MHRMRAGLVSAVTAMPFAIVREAGEMSEAVDPRSGEPVEWKVARVSPQAHCRFALHVRIEVVERRLFLAQVLSETFQLCLRACLISQIVQAAQFLLPLFHLLG